MIKAVIFDLNGVFILGPKLSERFSKDFNVSIEDFLPALKTVMAVVRLPSAPSIYECFSPFLQKWNIKLSEHEFENYWFNAETENTEMVTLGRAIKRVGCKLFLLSNNFKERGTYYASHFPFIEDIFDKIYFSYLTGYIKPDVRAYMLLLEENDLKSSECIYFDDSKENVKVATSLGIVGHMYDGVEDVQRIFSEHILL